MFWGRWRLKWNRDKRRKSFFATVEIGNMDSTLLGVTLHDFPFGHSEYTLPTIQLARLAIIDGLWFVFNILWSHTLFSKCAIQVKPFFKLREKRWHNDSKITIIKKSAFWPISCYLLMIDLRFFLEFSKGSSDLMSLLPFPTRFKCKHIGEITFIGDISTKFFPVLIVSYWFIV